MFFGEYIARHSAILAVPFFFVLFFVVGLVDVKAVTVYGVNTSNQLVRFDSATPGTVSTPIAISGLQAGETILGIDFRPANGQLYGLGSTSRLYVINIATGVATQVGTAGAFTLSGTDFGFDFNPTVDRIRVVSNTGQNIRLNPDTGALAATDTPLNPGSPSVNAAAYTNNFAGATTTTLYVIDTTTNSLYTQNPPNAGTLNLVGPLGVVAGNSTGFDIASFGGQAYATLVVGGISRLYLINLSTGTATLLGSIGGGNTLRGLAIAFGSPAATVLDYDGDRRTDYSIFRPGTSTFFVARSSTNLQAFQTAQFGLASDIQTPGDYDGDGRTDYAVWRPSNGVFYVLRSSDGQVQTYQFGQNGDEPVARDYDGDGRTDFAVVRRTGGQLIWYIANSASGTFRIEQFGLSSDVTAPGDYDGDGKFDLAIFRQGSDGRGTFYVARSSGGVTIAQFGLGTDYVVPGDYDGDGKTDFAVVRLGSPYTWFILRSSDGGVFITQFGTKPHYTTQGDYDGDGRTDISVWDPITGTFYVLRSSDGVTSQYRFGQNGDYPVANYDTH
ncbi:MAG TPA: DUF4394 domain-containing protein [Pyrinomonadaceae bacterium]|nr:DUF4394 domain-containing protein [Pyrinomonadaceae bacterium]